jgi:hypothetical protein
MGGRRSYSIKSFIRSGPGIPAQKANLTKAIQNDDIAGIARSSANLLTQHRDLAKIFILSQKLLESIKSRYKSEDLDTVKQISIRVRSDWAQYKRAFNIESDKIIDDAVIFSVSKFFKDRKR